ncbi:Glycosyltransferase family 4 protein [Rhodovastum atsumiense]|uniref:Glycosyltransferase family 4 protein n=1 Tax=Rhodovastum atsumiense TaxID=504468 RepID=A0A5M6J172_9PROT|nr:glycosyltransferase family 4 protein [Rhodovastum atsumiense]KAA5614284.1 glycosyltransferase family 4 protein [Rhodovastum atsumiense]CAH2604740.1 Glycosyltransferase family 4 protein [Rhodovastum atsumiense]
MRIAQIAPLFEAVPPKLYGGTERVVSNLTEELVALGHDVTLFASGDSVTSAKLDAPWPRALRLDPDIRDWVSTYAILIEHVRHRAHEFDVLHFHIDYWPNSVFSRQHVPFLTTLHGRLDLPEFAAVYRMFPNVPLISISNSQRKPLPDVGWVDTVYHGIPAQLLTPQPAGERDYFAFLGRISPEKGIERAIQIAGRCGVKLKVAAKVDKADAEYFKNNVEPLLANANVEFIGEINDAQKPAFLSGAKALLFPIDWPEPFGLVMIEAMACGCPVIAMRRGSVPEVMDDGLTGFVVENVDEAVAACGRLDQIDRQKVRAQFDKRFTARRMAEDYVAVYERLIEAGRPQLRAVGD